MGITNILKNRNKVLGLNKRNLTYIRKYNKDKAKEIADNKILTKTVLEAADIPTPKLLAVIDDYRQLINFDWSTLPKSFVMKPVFGLEGGGIDIFFNRDEQGRWIRADKSRVSEADLKRQCIDILNGKYSLAQEPDKILFEERVQNHKAFKYYSYKGIPDIRIITYNNIPTMAMLRLPTRESEGKANLALGAVGAGIDIATGVTTSAIYGKTGGIEYIPGTKIRVSGLKIPYWESMLKYAIQAQKATNLNFAAIDFLIDREKGPMIVEMNARPGLSIQLANDDGLRWRLRKAYGLKVSTIEKGIRLGKDLFGGTIEAGVEQLTGKDVIGIVENITLYGKEDQESSVKAKIDTGADSTSMDKALAIKLGFDSIIKLIDSGRLPTGISSSEGHALEKPLYEELKDEYPDLAEVRFVQSSHGSSMRPYVNLSLKIQDTKFETKASIYDRSKLTYPIIVGRKSLFKFLVDPSKKNHIK